MPSMRSHNSLLHNRRALTIRSHHVKVLYSQAVLAEAILQQAILGTHARH